MRRIVVGVHDSATSRLALRWAARRVAGEAIDLHVVTALPETTCGISPEGMAWYVPRSHGGGSVSAWLQALISDVIATDPGVGRALDDTALRLVERTSAEAVVGSAISVLRRSARDADLLVIGASGRRRFARVRPGALAPLPCPVMVVERLHVP